MKKIKLSLSPEYVLHWTTNDALREIFQNALDQGKMKIEYIEKDKTLRVTSRNVDLDKKTLLLGKTEKDGKSTIGQFGEGYKLALLVLVRNNIGVKVLTGREVWRPRFEMDKVLECKMLVVNIEETETSELDTTFEITGIDKNVYENYVKKNLHLLKKYPEHIKTTRGNVLLNTKYVGKIFINGLYITSLPNFKWGYDFKPGVLTLGRDRSLVSEFDIKWHGIDIVERFADENPDAIIDEIENANDEYDKIKSDLYYIENMSSGSKESIAKRMLGKYTDKETYFYHNEDGKKFKGTPVKVSKRLMAIIRGTTAYKQRIKTLDSHKKETPAEIMAKWLGENKEYMSSKAINSFMNTLIPALCGRK